MLKGIISIDLIHDTRHLCKRLKTDGLKPMARGFSGCGGGGGGGGIKWEKIANAINVSRFVYFRNIK